MSSDRMLPSDWDACWALVLKLWPSGDPRAGTRETWERGLRCYSASVVQEAIRDVATLYNYPTPSLARVIDRTQEVARQRRIDDIKAQLERRRRGEDALYERYKAENVDIIEELRSVEPARLARAARAAQRALLIEHLGPGSTVGERAAASIAGDKFLAENPNPEAWSERLRGLTWAALHDERRTAKLLGEVQEVTQ